METGVEISATIFYNREAKIAIGGFDQRQRTTPLVAIPNSTSVSISLAPRIMARSVPANALTRCLVTTISPSLGAIAGGIAPSGPSKKLLMLSGGLSSAEENVPRTNLWQSRTKANLDVDNGYSHATRMIEHA